MEDLNDYLDLLEGRAHNQGKPTFTTEQVRKQLGFTCSRSAATRKAASAARVDCRGWRRIAGWIEAQVKSCPSEQSSASKRKRTSWTRVTELTEETILVKIKTGNTRTILLCIAQPRTEIFMKCQNFFSERNCFWLKILTGRIHLTEPPCTLPQCVGISIKFRWNS